MFNTDNQSLSGSLLRIQEILPLVVTIHHPITKDHKLEMQIVKLRDRLLQRQDTDRAETALRHSALHAREILNEIEKLQT